jgi:hypothetical protein
MIPGMQRLMLIGLSAAALSVQAQPTNFFPVMAWNSVPADLAVLKKMRDCGFTVAGFAPPKALKLCRKAGLMALVSDARVSGYDWTKVDDQVARRNVTSLIKEVGKNPAVYGYYLRDEPGAALFPGLAKLVSLLREKAPGKWPYIDLFPNYADADQLGVATYPEYLEKFCAVCRPTALSYDHYALLDDGSLRNGYWQNLEQMRAVAHNNALPFWNIVLSVAHFNFRELSAADLRFEAYSTLAYGARGIAWFTYFSTQFGNSRMAPIDQFGHPTATWGYLQNANLQIGALGPTLLQLDSDDVYHLTNVPEGCHGSTNKDLVTGVEAGDFMAGDFTHRDGSRYVLMLNKDVYKSVPCVPHYRTAPKRVQFVSPYTGRLQNFEGGDLWLAPGQGVLLKVE